MREEIEMLSYHFEVVNANPLKGHRLEGTKDYQTKVVIQKDDKPFYEGIISVRKNIEGVFPDVDAIKDKALSSTIRKELSKNLKEYFKKAR